MDYIDLEASIDDIINNFGNWYSSMGQIYERRYPTGKMIMDKTSQQDFAEYMSNTGSFQGMAGSIGFGLHEVSHKLTRPSGSGPFFYQVSRSFDGEDVVTEVEDYDGFDSSGITFPRKEIFEDLPQEAQDVSYTDTYISGFLGDAGFMPSLDELNAYTLHLYADWSTAPEYNGSRSSRDGLSAFLIYVETYLHRWRTVYPDDYQKMMETTDLRRTTVDLFDRGLCAVLNSLPDKTLTMNDDVLVPLILDGARLIEVARLR